MASGSVTQLHHSFHRRHMADGLITEVQADMPSENALS